MSLYEVLSMNQELERMDRESENKPETPMSQERIEQLKKRWAGLGIPDVVV